MRILLAILSLGLLQVSHPATIATLPDLDLWDSGSAFALAEDPEGKLYVGGSFKQIQGESRENLAKLTVDGSVDPQFAPSVDGFIYSIKIQNDGSVLIAGDFTTVNDQPRQRLARFLPDGSLDPDWTPNLNDTVISMAFGSDNDVFVGGVFTQTNGAVTNRIARLDLADGSLREGWAIGTDGPVWTLLADGSGQIWAGGEFAEVNGVSTGGLVLIEIESLQVQSFGLQGHTYAVDRQANGTVYVCGEFLEIMGQPRHSIARMDANLQLDLNWAPEANGLIYDCSLSPSGLLVAGILSALDAQDLGGVARFNLDGGEADTAFLPSLSGSPSSRPKSESAGVVIRELSDGSVFVGGTFRYVDSTPASGAAILDASAATTIVPLDLERTAAVTQIVQLPDESWLIGGTFRRAGELLRDNLMRLDANGAPDPNWFIGTNGPVRSILLEDEAAFIGGQFSRLGDSERTGLGRMDLESEGLTVNEDWAPSISGTSAVLTMELDRDRPGFMYVGGLFDHHGPDSYNARNLIRIASSGTGDTDTALLDIATNGQINAIAQTNDGVTYLGGVFSSVRGVSRRAIAAFDSNDELSLRTNFNAGLNNLIWAIKSDDSLDVIYATGLFTRAFGQNRSGAFKLQNGQLDENWAPSITAGAAIRITKDSEDTLLLSGNFQQVNGIERGLIARVNSAGTGDIDQSFSPSISGSVIWSTAVSHQALWLGGDFVAINGEDRRGIARFAIGTETEDDLFSDRFQVQQDTARNDNDERGTPRKQTTSCIQRSHGLFAPSALRTVQEPGCP